MCIGVPGKVISVDKESEIGEVDFGGVSRTVSMQLCPEAEIGDYVLVHVGFAIQKLDKEDAEITLELLRELGEKSVEAES